MKHQTVCTALGGILHKKQRERTINNNSCSTTRIGFKVKEANEVTQIDGERQKATMDGQVLIKLFHRPFECFFRMIWGFKQVRRHELMQFSIIWYGQLMNSVEQEQSKKKGWIIFDQPSVQLAARRSDQWPALLADEQRFWNADG